MVKFPYAALVQKVFKWPIFYGSGEYGDFWYGGLGFLSGIYQIRGSKKGRNSWLIDFYNYVITHTPGQQARREKFILAVAGWQALTESEKLLYINRAKNKNYTGYNLYIREFMLSN